MTERCDFSDLPVESCAHCRQITTAKTDTMFQANDNGLFGPWITAKWPGRCSADYRHVIVPGAQIRADGDGGWLCEECGLGELHDRIESARCVRDEDDF